MFLNYLLRNILSINNINMILYIKYKILEFFKLIFIYLIKKSIILS